MKFLSSPPTFFRIKAVLVLLLTLIGPYTKAAPLDVVINEIAWMGTDSFYSDEWVELHNITQTPIDLSGWKIIAQDTTPKITLSGVIPAQSFYLLERTDDNTIPGITADLIYAGVLSNKGEHLKLLDGQNNIIDEINCNQGWFAGDNTLKQTMERRSPQISGNSPENWQSSQNSGGTPKLKNTAKSIEKLPEILSLSADKLAEDNPLQVYPKGVMFNEILPSPEGSDVENEWVEIFNQNSFEVDLSDWQISDTIGNTYVYSIPKNTKIEPFGFLVFKRPETKITLNNDSDSLNLINPNGQTIDTVAYKKALTGKSYNLKGGEWVWSVVLTPEKANITTNPQRINLKENIASQKISIDPQGNDSDINLKQEISIASLQSSKSSFPPINVFVVALITALSSGIAILMLKKSITDKN